MIVCTKCQQHNADTEKFCQRCGAFLEFSGKPVAGSATLPPPPPGDDPATTPNKTTPERAGAGTTTEADADTAPVTAVAGDLAPTTPTATAQPGMSQPATSQPGATAGASGWGTPAAGTAAVRPDEAGLDRPYVPATDVGQTALAPGEIACPACGVGNVPTRTFCRSCGAQLTAAPVAAVAAPAHHGPADRRGLYKVIGVVAAIVVIAGLAFVLWPNDNSKGSGATPTSGLTAAPDTKAATTVAATVPPTFPAQPTPLCGTAHYADIGTDPQLASWFLSGRLYAQCAGEQGNVVSKDGYVLFPSGPACPELGQGLMLIVFDQPVAVRSVQLQPSPAPTKNYRWPVQARIVGYPDVDTNGPTQPAQGPNGKTIVRTSAKPRGAEAWVAEGVYNAKANTLTIPNANATPVRAIELQLLQYGDTPGRSGNPDPRCAVHRIQVTG